MVIVFSQASVVTECRAKNYGCGVPRWFGTFEMLHGFDSLGINITECSAWRGRSCQTQWGINGPQRKGGEVVIVRLHRAKWCLLVDTMTTWPNHAASEAGPRPVVAVTTSRPPTA